MGGLINPMPKHVASRTLKEPLTWNAQLLALISPATSRP